MSRFTRASFAIGSDGTVFLNFLAFGDGRVPRNLLRLAREPGQVVFVCVALSASEIHYGLKHVEDVVFEAAALIVGARGRKRSRRKVKLSST